MILENYLQTARTAVIAAGEYALQKLGERSFEQKQDGSLQSPVDLACDEIITETVKNAFPGIPVLSEERTFVPDLYDLFWVCDPIDGTTNYANEIPIFGISLALMHRGRPVAAAINLPHQREVLTAVAGQTTLLNGKPTRVKTTTGLNFSDVYTFSSWRAQKFSSALPGNIRLFGSSVYNSFQCATGRSSGGWDLSPKIWDLAAAWLIIEQAGGVILSVEGETLDQVFQRIDNVLETSLPSIYAPNMELFNLLQKDLHRT